MAFFSLCSDRPQMPTRLAWGYDVKSILPYRTHETPTLSTPLEAPHRIVAKGVQAMKKVLGIVFVAAVATLTALADKTTPQKQKHVMPCCYCACKMEDMKGCHKLCVLPDGDEGRKRTFTRTENQLCTELCAIKKEGCAHLNH